MLNFSEIAKNTSQLNRFSKNVHNFCFFKETEFSLVKFLGMNFLEILFPALILGKFCHFSS